MVLLDAHVRPGSGYYFGATMVLAGAGLLFVSDICRMKGEKVAAAAKVGGGIHQQGCPQRPSLPDQAITGEQCRDRKSMPN